MRNFFLSLLVMLLACGTVFSQKDPIKWGKVPAEDLAMKTYEADPTASAVVLCDYGKIRFKYDHAGSGYIFTRHKRVKVLSRSGFDQADVVVPFTTEQSFSNFKAQIFAPDGTKVELDRKDFFEENVNKFWNRMRFAFPNVKEGSVLEFRYSVKSNSLFNLREWFFQEDVPIRRSELRYEMLSYFNYSTVMRGGLIPTVNESESGSETLQGGVNVPTVLKRWVVENAPAIEQEPFMPCLDDYRSKMTFQLLSVDIPNRPFKVYEWPRIVKILQGSEYFGRQYLKKGASKKVTEAAQPALLAASTPLEKAQAAYDFVNEKVSWNGYYWYDTFGDLNKVLETGEGYSAELNLMVLALLRSQDIKAFPVVISTRSHGKPNPYYPLLSQFNHTVVKAYIDEKEYWIDAGDPLRPFGLLRKESLNGPGLLINDEEGVFNWEEIKPKKVTEVIYTTAEIDETGALKAHITCSNSAYGALSERKACGKSNGKTLWQNRFVERYPEAQLEEVKMENQNKLDQKFKNEIDVNLPGAGMVSGDMIYVSPTVYTKYAENPLKLEERTLPIEFAYPFTEQLITNLAIPEGYAVEGLPEGIRVSLPEKAGSFSYRVSESNGKIQVTSKMSIAKTFFLPEEYAGLRNFFSLVEEKMGEQIVLKKQT